MGDLRPRCIAGSVPEPEELIGREGLIRDLWDHLNGNNVLLIAPRRFGKTGVMRHLCKRPQTGFVPVSLEVEDIDSPAAFAAELIKALLEHSKLRSVVAGAKRLPGELVNLIARYVGEVSVDEFRVTLKEALGDTWETVTRRLVLELEKADGTVVFLVDEFPQCVENIAQGQGEADARRFLAWFRKLRMQQKDQLRRFRFVVGGSTGIDVILRRLEAADKLNDFIRLPVGSISEDDALRLIGGLANHHGLQFTEGATRRLLELLGPPVPYFIHLVVSQVLVDAEASRRPIAPEDIDRVYHSRVIGPACKGYFNSYRQRLKRYGEPRERAAVPVLREIAGSSLGRVSDSALFDVYRKARGRGASDVEFLEVLADMECDWYVSLDPATNEYYFVLNAMRDWWRRFYRSIGDRPEKATPR